MREAGPVASRLPAAIKACRSLYARQAVTLRSMRTGRSGPFSTKASPLAGFTRTRRPRARPTCDGAGRSRSTSGRMPASPQAGRRQRSTKRKLNFSATGSRGRSRRFRRRRQPCRGGDGWARRGEVGLSATASLQRSSIAAASQSRAMLKLLSKVLISSLPCKPDAFARIAHAFLIGGHGALPVRLLLGRMTIVMANGGSGSST